MGPNLRVTASPTIVNHFYRTHSHVTCTIYWRFTFSYPFSNKSFQIRFTVILNSVFVGNRGKIYHEEICGEVSDFLDDI